MKYDIYIIRIYIFMYIIIVHTKAIILGLEVNYLADVLTPLY